MKVEGMGKTPSLNPSKNNKTNGSFAIINVDIANVDKEFKLDFLNVQTESLGNSSSSYSKKILGNASSTTSEACGENINGHSNADNANFAEMSSNIKDNETDECDDCIVISDGESPIKKDVTPICLETYKKKAFELCSVDYSYEKLEYKINFALNRIEFRKNCTCKSTNCLYSETIWDRVYKDVFIFVKSYPKKVSFKSNGRYIIKMIEFVAKFVKHKLSKKESAENILNKVFAIFENEIVNVLRVLINISTKKKLSVLKNMFNKIMYNEFHCKNMIVNNIENYSLLLIFFKKAISLEEEIRDNPAIKKIIDKAKSVLPPSPPEYSKKNKAYNQILPTILDKTKATEGFLKTKIKDIETLCHQYFEVYKYYNSREIVEIVLLDDDDLECTENMASEENDCHESTSYLEIAPKIKKDDKTKSKFLVNVNHKKNFRCENSYENARNNNNSNTEVLVISDDDDDSIDVCEPRIIKSNLSDNIDEKEIHENISKSMESKLNMMSDEFSSLVMQNGKHAMSIMMPKYEEEGNENNSKCTSKIDVVKITENINENDSSNKRIQSSCFNSVHIEETNNIMSISNEKTDLMKENNMALEKILESKNKINAQNTYEDLEIRCGNIDENDHYEEKRLQIVSNKFNDCKPFQLDSSIKTTQIAMEDEINLKSKDDLIQDNYKKSVVKSIPSMVSSICKNISNGSATLDEIANIQSVKINLIGENSAKFKVDSTPTMNAFESNNFSSIKENDILDLLSSSNIDSDTETGEENRNVKTNFEENNVAAENQQGIAEEDMDNASKEKDKININSKTGKSVIDDSERSDFVSNEPNSPTLILLKEEPSTDKLKSISNKKNLLQDNHELKDVGEKSNNSRRFSQDLIGSVEVNSNNIIEDKRTKENHNQSYSKNDSSFGERDSVQPVKFSSSDGENSKKLSELFNKITENCNQPITNSDDTDPTRYQQVSCNGYPETMEIVKNYIQPKADLFIEENDKNLQLHNFLSKQTEKFESQKNESKNSKHIESDPLKEFTTEKALEVASVSNIETELSSSQEPHGSLEITTEKCSGFYINGDSHSESKEKHQTPENLDVECLHRKKDDRVSDRLNSFNSELNLSSDKLDSLSEKSGGSNEVDSVLDNQENITDSSSNTSEIHSNDPTDFNEDTSPEIMNGIDSENEKNSNGEFDNDSGIENAQKITDENKNYENIKNISSNSSIQSKKRKFDNVDSFTTPRIKVREDLKQCNKETSRDCSVILERESLAELHSKAILEPSELLDELKRCEKEKLFNDVGESKINGLLSEDQEPENELTQNINSKNKSTLKRKRPLEYETLYEGIKCLISDKRNGIKSNDNINSQSKARRLEDRIKNLPKQKESQKHKKSLEDGKNGKRKLPLINSETQSTEDLNDISSQENATMNERKIKERSYNETNSTVNLKLSENAAPEIITKTESEYVSSTKQELADCTESIAKRIEERINNLQKQQEHQNQKKMLEDEKNRKQKVISDNSEIQTFEVLNEFLSQENEMIGEWKTTEGNCDGYDSAVHMKLSNSIVPEINLEIKTKFETESQVESKMEETKSENKLGFEITTNLDSKDFDQKVKNGKTLKLNHNGDNKCQPNKVNKQDDSFEISHTDIYTVLDFELGYTMDYDESDLNKMQQELDRDLNQTNIKRIHDPLMSEMEKELDLSFCVDPNDVNPSKELEDENEVFSNKSENVICFETAMENEKSFENYSIEENMVVAQCNNYSDFITNEYHADEKEFSSSLETESEILDINTSQIFNDSPVKAKIVNSAADELNLKEINNHNKKIEESPSDPSEAYFPTKSFRRYNPSRYTPPQKIPKITATIEYNKPTNDKKHCSRNLARDEFQISNSLPDLSEENIVTSHLAGNGTIAPTPNSIELNSIFDQLKNSQPDNTTFGKHKNGINKSKHNDSLMLNGHGNMLKDFNNYENIEIAR